MTIGMSENFGISDNFDWGGNKWDNCEEEDEEED